MEIGVDIGGTKIAAGVVHNGRVLRKLQIPTPKSKAKIVAELRRLLELLGKKLPVGIGVPGTYHGSRTLILPNIRVLQGVDMAKALGRKVTLENDSRVFALAEHAHGAGKGSSSMIGIIIGTGIGTGIIIDGKLHHGVHGAAGEFGHVITDLDAKSLRMLQNDWSAFLSGPSILRRHHENGGTEPTLALAWHANTKAAKKTRDDTIRLLAIFLANIQVVLDPERIVIGGGVGLHLPLVKGVNRIIRRYGGLPVHQATLSDAGIIGAALIARAR